jgi:hypothetical protein
VDKVSIRDKGANMKRVLSSVAVMVLAGSAVAGPRDSITLTNVNSDGPNNGGFNAFPVAASYPVKFVRIKGTLTKVTTGNTYVDEALVQLFQPDTITPMVFSCSPTRGYSGSVMIDTFVRTPLVASSPAGNWGISTFEAVDDGAGPDSRWDTLTVTLNDGPPASRNLGALFNSSVTKSESLALNQTLWYKFELQGDVNAGGTYLDIDTEGSTIGAPGLDNDTVLAVYNENGFVVGYDDDDGSIRLSQLSFGTGTRPGIADAAAYNGRDGNLPAGTYYLAVRAFTDGMEPAVGWDFPVTGSLRSGTVKVTIRTNVGTSQTCPADFNQDGSLGVQDIFDFLNGWFAGCP